MDKNNFNNITPFKGQNYNLWKDRVRDYLDEKNLLRVVDDDIPEDPSLDYELKNKRALFAIKKFLDDTLYCRIKAADGRAKTMFKMLDEVYERKSQNTMISLTTQLMTLKAEKEEKMEDYFSRIEDLCDQLILAGGKMAETTKIAILINGLPTEFSSVQMTLRAKENVTLNGAKNLLLETEASFKCQQPDSGLKALVASDSLENQQTKIVDNNRGRGGYSFRGRGHHRGRGGYNRGRGQYRGRGVPRRGNSNNFNQNRGGCFQCGRSGHKRQNCRYYLQNLEYLKKKNAGNTRTEESSALLSSPAPPSRENCPTSMFMMMAGDARSVNFGSLDFIIDSGSSAHIIMDDSHYIDSVRLEPPIPIQIAKKGDYIYAQKRGNVKIITLTGAEGILEDVLFCPEAPANLLSVECIQRAGIETRFKTDGNIEFIKNGKVIICCNKDDSQKLRLSVQSVMQSANLCNSKCNYNIWHQRLGHISRDKFLQLSKRGMVYDISLIQNISPNLSLCESCIMGKQTRLPATNSKDKTYINRPLQNIHSDICGPITPPTIDGNNYFMIFIDEYTHFTGVYLAKNKSELVTIFKDYVQKCHTNFSKFNYKVTHLYIDNGSEYLSYNMKVFCSENGITYHTTIPHTPHQNGVSERMIRTVTEKARSMLFESKLPQQFWGEAVLTASFLINMSPTKALRENKTPFELWHGKKPVVKYLRVFGSTVYVHDKNKGQKFLGNSLKRILVGYTPNGYKVFNAETSQFERARDVVIDEMDYLVTRPLLNIRDIESLDKSSDWLPNGYYKKKFEIKKNMNLREKTDENKSVEKQRTGCKSPGEQRPGERLIAPEREKTGSITPGEQRPGESLRAPENFEKITGNESSDSERSERDTEIPENRKGKRHALNKNEIIDSHRKRSKINNDENLRRSERNKNKAQISYDENDDEFENVIFRAEALSNDIPNSFQEIKSRPDRHLWEAAIQAELKSLLENETWTLVPEPPKNENIVDCKWVFSIKTDEFGNPVRYKARLVARGFSQQYLIDYKETFSPVARISSFRFILAIAVEFGLFIHHMDVVTAFLNGKLKERIFMKVPEGIENKNNLVCLLKKAIYGLKQAGRCWFEIFEETLLKMGFKCSSADRCVFFLDNKDVKKNIYVVLYVDDIVIVCGDLSILNAFKAELSKIFHMKDLKDIKLFLGIRVTVDKNQVRLDQTKYIYEILRKFKFYDCNSRKTPLNKKLEWDKLDILDDCKKPCQNLLGCLMYLMLCTRPDLSFAVNLISRFVNKNNDTVWEYLKGILRYLKGTSDLKLVYKRNFNENIKILTGFVDSDWATDETCRKSITGYTFKLFENCTVTWSTRKQSSVAASSTAAEYMALNEAVWEAKWLKNLCESLNFKIEDGVLIYEDNNGCIVIAKNESYKLSKHIDVHYHRIRDDVKDGVIKLCKIHTDDQIADILTKSLETTKFVKFRSLLGLE